MATILGSQGWPLYTRLTVFTEANSSIYLQLWLRRGTGHTSEPWYNLEWICDGKRKIVCNNQSNSIFRKKSKKASAKSPVEQPKLEAKKKNMPKSLERYMKHTR